MTDRARDEHGRYTVQRQTVVAPLAEQSKESKKMNELIRNQRSFVRWREEFVIPAPGRK